MRLTIISIIPPARCMDIRDRRCPETSHPGGILMRWPWIREARLIQSRKAVNTSVWNG
jgi:hypothetical protein